MATRPAISAAGEVIDEVFIRDGFRSIGQVQCARRRAVAGIAQQGDEVEQEPDGEERGSGGDDAGGTAGRTIRLIHGGLLIGLRSSSQRPA